MKIEAKGFILTFRQATQRTPHSEVHPSPTHRTPSLYKEGAQQIKDVPTTYKQHHTIRQRLHAAYFAAMPRPRPGPPRPRNPPPRISPPLTGGPPPRGLLTGRSPRSLRVSTEMRICCPSPTSTRIPPSPPWGTGRDAAMARRADSTLTNSRNAHALLRTTSSSLIGPNRFVSVCRKAWSDTFSCTLFTKH